MVASLPPILAMLGREEGTADPTAGMSRDERVAYAAQADGALVLPVRGGGRPRDRRRPVPGVHARRARDRDLPPLPRRRDDARRARDERLLERRPARPLRHGRRLGRLPPRARAPAPGRPRRRRRGRASGCSRTASAEFGSSRLILGGESAGGYMAAIVLLRIRDELDAVDRVARREPRVRRLRLGSLAEPTRHPRRRPAPTCSTPTASSSSPSATCPGSTDDERRDPSISPAFADLHDLPPALMSVGTSDHLLDDTLMLAGALGRGRQRGRAARPPRAAPRLHGRAVRADQPLGDAHLRVVRPAPRPRHRLTITPGRGVGSPDGSCPHWCVYPAVRFLLAGQIVR